MAHVKAFGIGQAKSGTASLVGLLGGNYRAAHEPERADLLDIILRESREEITSEALQDYLIRRDERLALEYDVAWANQFIIGSLMAAFPDAKVICLVRDPYGWIQSIVGHLMSRQIPDDVRAFLDWWFKPDQFPHTPADERLRALGLYSVGAFLSAWDRHVRLCDSLPVDRTLILRTHELSRSHQRLADFLQIPVETLDTRAGRSNRGTWTGSLDTLVTREYLDEKIREICGLSMSRHFPETA
jgi:hypothetical protein